MIDCDPKATAGYERNTIILKKWEGDPTDQTLFELVPLLLGKFSASVFPIHITLKSKMAITIEF